METESHGLSTASQPAVATDPIAAEAVQSSAAPAKPPKQVKRYAVYGFIGVLVVAIVAVFGVGVYRAKAEGATDSFTVGVAKFLHLKAATVDGVAIPYADYATDMRAIAQMRAAAKQKGTQGNPIEQQTAALTDDQMSDQVLLRLINDILIQKAADTYHITLTDADVDAVKKNEIFNKQSQDQVEKDIQTQLGWSFATWEERVLRPMILKRKVQQAIQSDPTLLQAMNQKVQAALSELNNGADFAAVARKYGEDGTAANGGELPLFGKGEMVPEFENAAFALKVGEYTKQPVKTVYGLHIIKLEARETNKVKGADGKTKLEDQLKVRHILILAPDVDRYLDDELLKADFHLNINVHNPLDTIKAVNQAASQQ